MKGCRDVTNGNGAKTPSRGDKGFDAVSNKSAKKTPGGNSSMNRGKTPGKTPGKSASKLQKMTPSRNHNMSNNNGGSKTPGGDRFISDRGGTNMELGYYRMKERERMVSTSINDGTLGGSNLEDLEYQRVMSESLNGGVTGPAQNSSLNYDPSCSYDHQILHCRAAPQPPKGVTNQQKVLYSASACASSCKKILRQIPKEPERILDAPEILDDYYLNLVDWSGSNTLAVALHQHLYVWNAASGDIVQLVQLEGEDEYIASVSWIEDGNTLAVGLSTGSLQLWNVETEQLLRTMSSHTDRVGVLSWNKWILSSGCRTGEIHHNDVRVPEFLVGQLSGHRQEVCGLKWNPDGRYLASGGNDNIVNVWSQAPGDFTTLREPTYQLTEHQAAVKALAWCPWQKSMLASGGGTADRTIRLWNCNTGSCIKSFPTDSQVSCVLWSAEHKELISGHGYPSHELNIWSYPDMKKVAELRGHSQRVLCMSMSPDGQMVVSAAADETLRIWKCFATDPQKGKKTNGRNLGLSAKGRLGQGRMLTTLR